MNAPGDTKPTPPAEQWAWHYTTRAAYRAINASGYLLPTPAGFASVERYLAWFSMCDTFEPSALRYITDQGTRRRATVPEMAHAGRGLVRLGYSPYRLLRGRALLAAAHIDPVEWDLFAQAGRAAGADPRFWYASIRPIAIETLIAELLDPAGRWIRVADGDGKR